MRRRKMGSKALRAICTVYGSTTSMDLITSRFTPNRMPAVRLIWRSKLNFTSSARSSPKPLWNCTPFLSLNVHTVPSGESVQLSARSGSTSAVVTLPSLMAKRVRPRNMKREIAWLCPRVLEWGSSVSGSLAAMLTIFFCASATGVSTRPQTANAVWSTRHTTIGVDRDIGLSPFTERTNGERDRRPERFMEGFQDVARDWSIVASSNRFDSATRMAATIYERRAPDKRCRARHLGAHEHRAAVEERQHLVRLRRGHVEDEPRDAGITVALDEIAVLGHAEDRDGQRRGVAPGLDHQFPEV